MQRVWVRMSADTSRTHGACLRMHILAPGNLTIPRSLWNHLDDAPGLGTYSRHPQPPGPLGTGIRSQGCKARGMAEAAAEAGMRGRNPGGASGTPEGADGGLLGTADLEGSSDGKRHRGAWMSAKSSLVQMLEGFQAGGDRHGGEGENRGDRACEVYLVTGVREQDVDADEEYGEESGEVLAWKKLAEAGRWAVLAERCGPAGDPARHATCMGLAQGLLQDAHTLQAGEAGVAEGV